MALLWSAHAHGEEVEERHPPKIKELIDIHIPDGFFMEERNPDANDIMDFRVFFVKKSKKAYVGIYLGGHPQFPDQEKPSMPGERKRLATHENGRIVHEEILIKTPRYVSWPVFIHAWIIDDLSDDERLIGSQILETISGKLQSRINLARYNREDLALSGIRRGKHSWQACFGTPDGFHVTTYKGQHMGEDFGLIVNIEDSSVTVKEFFEEQEQGDWSERIIKMDLPRNSICDWKNSVPNYGEHQME